MQQRQISQKCNEPTIIINLFFAVVISQAIYLNEMCLFPQKMKPTYSISCSGFIAFHFIIKLINDDVYIIKSISTLKNWIETTNIYKYVLYKISLIQFEFE